MNVLDYLRNRGGGPPRAAASDSRFLALAEASGAMVWVLEGDVIRYANKAARGPGLPPRTDYAGTRFSDLAHPDSRGVLRQRLATAALASPLNPNRFELLLEGPAGSETWVDITLNPIEHEGREAVLATGFDVTDRKLAENALRESERRLRDLIENVQLVSILLNAEGEVTFANEYALELLGLSEENVLGRDWFELVLPLEKSGTLRAIFRDRIVTGTTPHEEYEILTSRGDARVVSWNSTVLRDPSGAICGMASSGADVTERRRAETRLLHDALHDSLTGLPNRALFMDRLHTAMARIRRRPTHLFGVLFLDLDRFKMVNDSLGHLAGDQFLVQIGRILQAALRAEHRENRRTQQAVKARIHNSSEALKNNEK